MVRGSVRDSRWGVDEVPPAGAISQATGSKRDVQECTAATEEQLFTAAETCE